jgi:hypothetical protein
MKTRTIKITITSLALMLAILLTGCGASSIEQFDEAMEPEAVEKVLVSNEGGVSSDFASDASTLGGEGSMAQVERMIIWNANISLTVDDTQSKIEAVQAIAQELGGFTVASEAWQSNDQLYAQLTIRVPAERFEDAMGRLRDLAITVNRESASSEDVTEQYVDLESRLRHLEAKEAQLLEFLDGAEDTESVLAVYEQLSLTQAEIEQVKGRMRYLQTLSALATIVVEIYPEEMEPPVVEQGWKPGRTLRDAARALVNTLEAVADLLIWAVIYLLPILVFVAIPVVVIVWLVRRRRRGKREASNTEQ